MMLADANGPMPTVEVSPTGEVTGPTGPTGFTSLTQFPTPTPEVVVPKTGFNWGWAVGIVLVVAVVLLVIKKALKK